MSGIRRISKKCLMNFILGSYLLTKCLSKLKALYEQDNRTISFEEAFYMATLGCGDIFGKVSSFKPGYDFDALVISGLQDPFMELSPKELIERFCYSGDVSNIKVRFLRGKTI